MVLRIIQHMLLCATLGAIVLAHDILLKPSSAEVREFGSINLTCSHSNYIKFMALKTINTQKPKRIGDVYLESCIGEGLILDDEAYAFYCIDNKSLIVTLKSVKRSSHMDHFTCEGVSSTSNIIPSNEAILYVTIPVSNIVLQNGSKTSVTTMERTETVFVCITEKVYPAPDILWYANDTVLPNGTLNASITQVATTNEYPRSYMSILKMFPERFDNSIMCTANNTNDKQMSRLVRMLVYFPPDTPSLSDKESPLTGHVSVLTGNSLVIECSSQSYPKPHYQWEINNEVFAAGHILNISNVSHARHAGTLTCKVNNTMALYNGNRYGFNETSVTVAILYGSSVKRLLVDEQAENVTVNEKDNVTISCQVDGKPLPNVTLSYDGKVLKKQPNDEMLLHRANNVTCAQMGKYECQSLNKYNRSPSSATINIAVRCSPRPNQNMSLQSYFASALFDNTTISFEIYAFPEPGESGFTWQKWEKATQWINLYNGFSTSISSSGLQSNLTLRNITQQSFGNYRFNVTNDVGSYTHEFVLSPNELGEVNPSTSRLLVTVMSGGIFSILVIVVVSVGVVVYKRRFRNIRNNKKKPNTFEGATVEKRNTSGHVLPNDRAALSTLEESEDTGIYENLLSTTSPISTSIQGTKRRTSQLRTKKQTNNGRKSASRVRYKEDCHDEEHSVNIVETNGQPEPDSILQNDGTHETRIPVSSLFKYVTNSSYDTEFSLLPKGLQYPATVARKPENIALNRYNALFPYDHSRVVLLNDPSFYINACYIDGYRKRKAYIASLGPTAETTNNYITFWKMVWYENSDIIVMLTNLIEISGMKCQQYWPELDKTEHYGEVAVNCRHVENFAEYTIRTFDVSKNKVVKQLHQLHFTAWPDKSVPDDISSLLEFRQRLQTTFTTGHGPIIIHCSAGVGRTGTLIAINNLIDEGNRGGNVDVLNCVKRLREQRVYLVQTKQQYCFIYKTLVYALEYETDSITAEMFQKYLESKDDFFFECMFDRLHMDIEAESDVEERLINQNRRMLNRSGADIPGNKYRVRLYLDKQADDLDYINAVYLNSLKKKLFFIAAQTPTHVTVEDFIRMIFQENCMCIISLGESETQGNVYQNEDIGLYLPPDNQTLTVGNFTVSCTRLSTNPHYIVRRMKIKHDSKICNEEKVSYHFQYTAWDVDEVFPNDPSEFANFITDVDLYIASHTECSGHVLVHCLDASERCGVFCSIATMIEKVEGEHHVNIGNIVRQIRNRRRTVIQNMKQLRFCHQAVSAYINMVNVHKKCTH